MHYAHRLHNVLFTHLIRLCVPSIAYFCQQTSTSLNALADMPGSTAPIKLFDPLGLATVGSDETLNWFRAGELKNGRCAMVATVGYLTNAAGLHFPGMLSHDVSFADLAAMRPIDAWAAVPDAGKAQILATCFIAELVTESKPVHYTKGGPLPGMVFPPIDFSNVAPETMKRKQDSELNNGRLAMIAIMSFISEANIPGSVPALSGIEAFH